MKKFPYRIFPEDLLFKGISKHLNSYITDDKSVSGILSTINHLILEPGFMDELVYSNAIPLVTRNKNFLNRWLSSSALQFAWDLSTESPNIQSYSDWRKEGLLRSNELRRLVNTSSLDFSEQIVLDWNNRFRLAYESFDTLMAQEKYDDLNKIAGDILKSINVSTLNSMVPNYTSSTYSKESDKWNLTNWVVKLGGVSIKDDPLTWAKKGEVQMMNQPLFKAVGNYSLNLGFLINDLVLELENKGVANDQVMNLRDLADYSGPGGIFRKFSAQDSNLSLKDLENTSFRTGLIPLRVHGLLEVFSNWKDTLQKNDIDFKPFTSSGIISRISDTPAIDMDYNVAFLNPAPWDNRSEEVKCLLPYIESRCELIEPAFNNMLNDKLTVEQSSVIYNELCQVGYFPNILNSKHIEKLDPNNPTPFWGDFLSKSNPFQGLDIDENSCVGNVGTQSWWRALYKHCEVLGISREDACEVWKGLSFMAEEKVLSGDSSGNSTPESLESAIIASALYVDNISVPQAYALAFRCVLGSNVSRDKTPPMDFSLRSQDISRKMFSGDISVSTDTLINGGASSLISARSSWVSNLKKMDLEETTEVQDRLSKLLNWDASVILGVEGSKKISLGTALAKPEWWDCILSKSFQENLKSSEEFLLSQKLYELKSKGEFIDENGHSDYLNPKMSYWLDQVDKHVQVESVSNNSLFSSENYTGRSRENATNDMFRYGVTELSKDLDGRVKDQLNQSKSIEELISIVKTEGNNLISIQASGRDPKEMDLLVSERLSQHNSQFSSLPISFSTDEFSKRGNTIKGFNGQRFLTWSFAKGDPEVLKVFTSFLTEEPAYKVLPKLKDSLFLTGKNWTEFERANWVIRFLSKLDTSAYKGKPELYNSLYAARGALTSYSAAAYQAKRNVGGNTVDLDHVFNSVNNVSKVITEKDLEDLIPKVSSYIRDQIIQGRILLVLNEINKKDIKERKIPKLDVTSDEIQSLTRISQFTVLIGNLSNVVEALSKNTKGKSVPKFKDSELSGINI